MTKIKIKTNESKLEISFYFAVWIGSVLYAIYSFARISKKYFASYDDRYNDFKTDFDSWVPKKDVADSEWEGICYLIKTLHLWFIGHPIISEAIRCSKFNVQVLQYFHVIYPLSYLLLSCGWVCTVLILSQIVVFSLASKLRRDICIWICSLLCLLVITVLKKSSTLDELLSSANLNPYEINIVTVMLSWMNLRCTNFHLENSQGSFLASLAYCLYFPTLFTGPLISYADFSTSYNNSTNFPRLAVRTKQLVINLVRCSIWFLFTEVCLHYVYVNACGYQPELLKSMDIWALCGYGYSMGQFFHLKYVVSYGLATSLASFDHVAVPYLPRCIGRIHLYSDMWKYFDPGLYAFLVKYIYKPVRIKTTNKLLPSFVCFAFVYVWHGVDTYILIWASWNYVEICIEYLSEQFYKEYLLKTAFIERITIINLRRFKCLLAAPLLCLSAVSNFYFFAGSEVGHVFVQHLFVESVINKVLLWLVLYCCCQVSMELSTINARRM